MWYQVAERLAIQALTYNFLPSWWRQNYGVNFGERMVFDPEYRLETHRFMEKTVKTRFPRLHIGSEDPQRKGVLPDFGNSITAAAAGCEVVYPDDNYPWNHHLTVELIPKLAEPRDISATFPYSEIKSQVEYMRGKLGLEFPAALNSRGVLNDALLIGGADFFGWFTEGNSLAQSLLDYSAGMVRSTIDFNYGCWGYTENTFLANCTVMMVSPAMYERQFLPYDLAFERKLTGYGVHLGVHHCGNFERYAQAYRQIPYLPWIEIGWGSDASLALKLFPEATVSYILSAVFIANSSRQEVHDKIIVILESVRGNWHRIRLTMPDVEYGTPDENLEEIYWVCKEHE